MADLEMFESPLENTEILFYTVGPMGKISLETFQDN